MLNWHSKQATLQPVGFDAVELKDLEKHLKKLLSRDKWTRELAENLDLVCSPTINLGKAVTPKRLRVFASKDFGMHTLHSLFGEHYAIEYVEVKYTPQGAPVMR